MKGEKGASMMLLNKLEKLVEEIDDKFFYVVMGGIVVDGYVGKLTRDHPDVDIIIFRDDLEKMEQVLDNLGFKYKRFIHPKEPDFEYKMQTGDEDHLFSFQIADKVDDDRFTISFYRDLRLVFPLHFIKPPQWLELKGTKLPAISREFLIKLKENEIEFFEKLKNSDPEKYQKKRKRKHFNTLHDLELLNG